jgi:LuxR family maltose regulon positive regulatory protein
MLRANLFFNFSLSSIGGVMVKHPSSAILLRTKLNFPMVRQGLVSRERLTNRIEEGLKGKLLLISAPAGSGKTTLLTDWRATPSGSQFPVAWFSLEEADNDPSRFWTYVISALDSLQPGVGESALSVLKSIQPVPSEVVLAELINSIESSIPNDFALVLEDYHFISEQPIHRAITFLLNHLPTQMHLIIISRADPPLPLSRLRVRHEVVEIRATDLRFRKDEIAQFLSELALTENQLEGLETRTEGWIAGLQLAALSLRLAVRDCEDIDGFIHAFTGSHRLVLDYLAEEVLNQLPEDIRAFLYETSILERLSNALCEAVTGRSDSEAILDRISGMGLFLIPLSEERLWYRYHHLFAQVLRHRLKRLHPQGAEEYHLRAANCPLQLVTIRIRPLTDDEVVYREWLFVFIWHV